MLPQFFDTSCCQPLAAYLGEPRGGTPAGAIFSSLPPSLLFRIKGASLFLHVPVIAVLSITHLSHSSFNCSLLLLLSVCIQLSISGLSVRPCFGLSLVYWFSCTFHSVVSGTCVHCHIRMVIHRCEYDRHIQNIFNKKSALTNILQTEINIGKQKFFPCKHLMLPSSLSVHYKLFLFDGCETN